jgi:alternate signal-mediated exported protein
MKKSTKGAIAAGGAAVLLLGGAGSLAYWTSSANVAGGNISSGHLSIDDTTAGTCANAAWKIDSAETPAGATFDPATQKLVPGDTITKVCSFKVSAVGTHLRATAAVTGGSTTATWFNTTGSKLHDDTTNADLTSSSVITAANNNDVITGTIVVNFPYGDATTVSTNTTQDQTAVLNALAVTLTQVHS